MAWKMCTSGIVNYKAKDVGNLVFVCLFSSVLVGYFGSGVYVTPQAAYAAM